MGGSEKTVRESRKRDLYGLTEKQRRLLNHLIRSVETDGTQPTFHELAVGFCVSESSVYSTFKVLERKGFVELTGRARGVKLLKIRFRAEWR